MGGADAIIALIPELELKPIEPAAFLWPNPEKPGNHASPFLLRDALRLKLRAGRGPFRSFGNIAVEPRAYQLVPLLMALRLITVRLQIADDVGIGKTIEAGLIVRELMDLGEIGRLSKEAYFQQLLRLVYRLIFLFTVEERRVFHTDDDSKEGNAARKAYAEGRLRAFPAARPLRSECL